MGAALVFSVLVLVAVFGYLIERHSRRHGARATSRGLFEQQRRTCPAYLRESIATSLVHDPHHPGYSGCRR